MLNSDFI